MTQINITPKIVCYYFHTLNSVFCNLEPFDKVDLTSMKFPILLTSLLASVFVISGAAAAPYPGTTTLAEPAAGLSWPAQGYVVAQTKPKEEDEEEEELGEDDC